MGNGRGTGNRRQHDFYETAPWQTRALLHYVPEIAGCKILEPCSGDGSIERILRHEGRGLEVITNDLVDGRPADYHFDARERELYRATRPDWVVSNPPYKMPDCLEIVARAVLEARLGVAMMLRVTFTEPTAHVNPRGPWLSRNPIARQLTLPRYSFTGNGKADSATTAWFVWSKLQLSGPPLLSLYRADIIHSTIKEIEQGNLL